MQRILSLDIVRGAAMVLMAIDHVRVYAGVPAGGPDPAVFFTRWVTHFCAPVFVFLAGTAAYLYGLKAGSRGALAKFLIVRGLWLVLLELTLLRFAWTFNFDYAHFTFAGVIWVIGWSMVILGALVFLPPVAVAGIGVAIIAGHHMLAPTVNAIESPSWLLRVLYAGWMFEVPGLGWDVVVLYTLIPWAGVMAAGYGFGRVMELPRERRRGVCVATGIVAIALFVILRTTGIYGDPRPWDGSALGVLNTTKYPASLHFGQVPVFYYVLHIPLIHLIAVLISVVRTPESTGWLFANHPMLPPDAPPEYMWSLPLLYLVTALVVIALYFPSRAYAAKKRMSNSRWMRFL